MGFFATIGFTFCLALVIVALYVIYYYRDKITREISRVKSVYAESRVRSELQVQNDELQRQLSNDKVTISSLQTLSTRRYEATRDFRRYVKETVPTAFKAAGTRRKIKVGSIEDISRSGQDLSLIHI